MNISGNAEEELIKLGIYLSEDVLKLVKSGFKFTGKLSFELLKLALKNAKENDLNHGGLIALKKMISSSPEGLSTISISKGNIDRFKELAEKYCCPFAEIDSRVFYRPRDEKLITAIVQDIVKEKEKMLEEKDNSQNINDILLKKCDFVQYEEKSYRHCVEDISTEKAKIIDKLLKVKGINHDSLISDIKENSIDVVYKVDEKDKEKVKVFFNEIENLTIDQLSEELKRIDKKLTVGEHIENDMPLKDRLIVADKKLKENTKRENVKAKSMIKEKVR